MSDRRITVNITSSTVLTTILWVVGAIFALQLFSRITHALTLIFISFFLALALNPVVSWMSLRLKIKRRVLATAAAYFTVVGFLIGFFALITPPLIQQTRDFINEVPELVSNFQMQDSSIAEAARRYDIDEKLSRAANEFASDYSNFGGRVLDTGKRIISGIISLLVILAMTFMMLVEGPRWLNAIWALTPKRNRPHRKEIAHRMYKAVSGYVNAQVIVAAVAGTAAFLALTIATNLTNVSLNVIALAGIVALFGLIPLIGAPVSSAIVVVVCLLQSTELAVIMLIYFLVYYQIENLTFQPYIQSRLNQLTPLMVFIAAIIGIELAGFIGAFAAIPIATSIKVLIEDQLDRRGLNNKKAKET